MPKQQVNPDIISLLKQLNSRAGAAKSWIRAVREQHNMLGKQLAKKMQVSPARISVLEKDEQRGAVTLKMMQKAADALDCDFVYAFVPKSVQQQPKPKIRLDSDHMKGNRERQVSDLQRKYTRSLSKTTPD